MEQTSIRAAANKSTGRMGRSSRLLAPDRRGGGAGQRQEPVPSSPSARSPTLTSMNSVSAVLTLDQTPRMASPSGRKRSTTSYSTSWPSRTSLSTTSVLLCLFGRRIGLTSEATRPGGQSLVTP
ncbi:hypothetical protein DMA15_36125 [Streptomyces sp. WAC 01529]|nr:hypothetical protein DMA15_36125 [Streptomyces sp. WAC 01529]